MNQPPIKPEQPERDDPEIPNDEALIALYYGTAEETADNAQIAEQVASTPHLHARFEALAASLSILDEIPLPERGSDYGTQVWQRIANRLPTAEKTSTRWLQSLFQPRLSFASSAALVLVACAAFWFGKNLNQPPAVATAPLATAGANIDFYLARHLSEAERWLTHNANYSGRLDPEWTQMLLRNNRLHRITLDPFGARQALKTAPPTHPQQTQLTHPTLRLSRLLRDLELLLLEAANTAPQGSEQQALPQRSQQLLFQLRVLSQQLDTHEFNHRGIEHAPTI